MVEIIDAVAAALATGTNPATAIREASGYSLEQLAVTSGLAISEIMGLEAGETDPAKLARLASALGLPEDLVG